MPSPTPARTVTSAARASLEALVETSPVGVVVFDGATGRPVSFNRKARRITSGMHMPDRSAEQLLEVVTCRRGDRREVSLAEFPILHQMSTAETVRAEEMTLSVPDGRSVTTLVNATPIQEPDGTVESMVVTLQDLGPLEELEPACVTPHRACSPFRLPMRPPTSSVTRFPRALESC